uniref:Uncharacterized protein n=1 Tax=Trichuris muris TaxID=70415 RepID=A0A5S6Q3L8_TRIMR
MESVDTPKFLLVLPLPMSNPQCKPCAVYICGSKTDSNLIVHRQRCKLSYVNFPFSGVPTAIANNLRINNSKRARDYKFDTNSFFGRRAELHQSFSAASVGYDFGSVQSEETRIHKTTYLGSMLTSADLPWIICEPSILFTSRGFDWTMKTRHKVGLCNI